MNEKPIGCRCVARDDPAWHSKECWLRQTAALRQQLSAATYRLNVLEPEYTACQARAAAAEQHLHEALGVLGYPVPGDTPQGRYKCGLCEATRGHEQEKAKT